MTRWVRCGNSQKHKKMPGNATKWGEFDNQHSREIPRKKKKIFESQTYFNKEEKPSTNSLPSNKAEESLDEDFFEQDKYCLTGDSNKINEQENSTFDESHSIILLSKNEDDDNNFLTNNVLHDSKIKKKKKQNSSYIKDSSLVGSADEIDSSEVTVKHKKIKFENDCSVVTQNINMLEQVNNHCDFSENSKIPEESSSQEHDRKKKRKKKKKNRNKIDSESFSTNDVETAENSFENFNESCSIKQDVESIATSDITIELVQSLQNIDGPAKKQKRKKHFKFENDCSSVTQNIKMLEQANNHSDFSENNKIPEESFSQEHDRKKKRKKNKEKCNQVDSESFSTNDVTTENSFENSNESSSIMQDVECVASSDKTIEPVQSFQNIDGPAKKQKGKKCFKMNSDSNQSSVDNDGCKNSSSEVFENRKEKHLKKLKNKREELGLIQLPHNVENKLRKIKKRLIEKGFPPEKQKEILREERRKEELQFRKVFNPRKLCFGCREPGHVFADCPKKSEKQETGICFKCGSVEHISYKCPKKIEGFPFAKCFICKEQGHISRNCPQNKHGVYPKGGRCKLCGNVNHLRKDCPTLKKKENEEEFTLPTLNEGSSIDAEVVKKEEIKKKSHKKLKVVKF